MERTLCIIKPDGMKSYSNIVKDLIGEGFYIIKGKTLLMKRGDADEFYKENKGKAPHERNIKHMSSGRVRILVLEAVDAIVRLRAYIGATDPQKAKEGTLRHKYGSELPENAIHGSDGPISARREIEFFFDKDEIYI